METLRDAGVNTFVECGPGGVLYCALSANTIDDAASHFIPSLRKGTPENETMMDALGRIFSSGHDVDWSAVYAESTASRVQLPLYDFERVSYWLEPSAPLRAKPVGILSWAVYRR